MTEGVKLSGAACGEDCLRTLEALLRRCRATGVSLRANMQYTAEFVRELKSRGLGVVGWGVSSDELGLHLAEIGVDALTCNHAVALRKIWRGNREIR